MDFSNENSKTQSPFGIGPGPVSSDVVVFKFECDGSDWVYWDTLDLLPVSFGPFGLKVAEREPENEFPGPPSSARPRHCSCAVSLTITQV